MPSTPERTAFAERTALAWQRSALALGVLGALFLHAGRLLGSVTGAILIAAAAVAYESSHHPTEHPRLLRGLSALTVLAAVAAVLIVAGA
jgi:uncharacterized membrane protein YidH (DUF202 family)